MLRLPCLALLLVVVGCDGSLSTSGDDAGGSTDDAGTSGGTEDAWAPGPLCVAVSCGANERCDDATGACICLPGFVSGGSGCTAAPPGDPSTRSAADACMIWREAHRATASDTWTPGAGECDGGAMPRDATDDTLRRISGFRALVGLGPVVDDPALAARQQACAVMMFRNGSLSHAPPSSWRCYTPEGAEGAGRSNLALGSASSADTIDLYVDDTGVDSLGHRRWVLNGPLGRVGIGFAGNAGCLAVFDSSASTERGWISWPPPGPAPAATTGAWWSFQSTGGSISDASVTMVRASDGTDVTGEIHRLPDGFGGSAVAWSPTERDVGQRYRVTVTSGALGEVTYEVEIIDCP